MIGDVFEADEQVDAVDAGCDFPGTPPTSPSGAVARSPGQADDLAVVARSTVGTERPTPPTATIPRPMAVPKKRTSSARRDKRRANHKAGKARLNSCPRCHSPRLPHRVCPTCGTYAGREVITHTVAEPDGDARRLRVAVAPGAA